MPIEFGNPPPIRRRNGQAAPLLPPAVLRELTGRPGEWGQVAKGATKTEAWKCRHWAVGRPYEVTCRAATWSDEGRVATYDVWARYVPEGGTP